MTKKDIAEIVIKLFGLFGILYAILFLPTILFLYFSVSAINVENPRKMALILSPVLGSLSYFVISLLLIRYGTAISGRLFRSSHDEKIENVQIRGGKSIDGFRFWIKLLGVYALIDAIPSFSYTAIDLIFVQMVDKSTSIHQWSKLAVSVAEVGIGVYLIAGGRHIVNFAWRDAMPAKSDTAS